MSFTITPEKPNRDAMEIEKNSCDQIQREKETQLLQLPNELIVNILRNLSDFEDKWNFSLTCRTIRKIVWSEEKFLKLGQIKSLINLIEPYFNEKILIELKQLSCDLDKDKSRNFLKMTRTVFKIELLISNPSNLKQMESNKEIFEIILSFNGKNTSCSTLLLFLKNNPYFLGSLASLMFKSFGGEDEVLKKILKIKLLITPQDFDSIHQNIVKAFLARVNENNIRGVIEIAGENKECISLIYPHLKSIIKVHIESGEEENLQKAIELALLIPIEPWKCIFLDPIIVFLSKSNNPKNLQRAFHLANSFPDERIRCASLETILTVLTNEEMKRIMDLASNEVNRFYEGKEAQKF